MPFYNDKSLKENDRISSKRRGKANLGHVVVVDDLVATGKLVLVVHGRSERLKGHSRRIFKDNGTIVAKIGGGDAVGVRAGEKPSADKVVLEEV